MKICNDFNAGLILVVQPAFAKVLIINSINDYYF